MLKVTLINKKTSERIERTCEFIWVEKKIIREITLNYSDYSSETFNDDEYELIDYTRKY